MSGGIKIRTFRSLKQIQIVDILSMLLNQTVVDPMALRHIILVCKNERIVGFKNGANKILYKPILLCCSAMNIYSKSTLNILTVSLNRLFFLKELLIMKSTLQHLTEAFRIRLSR